MFDSLYMYSMNLYIILYIKQEWNAWIYLYVETCFIDGENI